jgi:hypothetical protein
MSFLTDLSDKLYDQTTRGWLGGKMEDLVGEDYHRHAINTTLTGGIPGGGYALDYQQAENEGESGWNRVGDNAKKSAAILATIFGGASMFGNGGGGAGGGGGGMSAVPVEEAGFNLGSAPSGGNWVQGVDGAGFGGGQGSGGSAINWQKMMGDALQNMGGQQQGGAGGGYGAVEQDPAGQGYPQQPQQAPGVYSSAPWTSGDYGNSSGPLGYDGVVRTPEQQAMLKRMAAEQSALTGGLYGLGDTYG